MDSIARCSIVARALHSVFAAVAYGASWAPLGRGAAALGRCYRRLTSSNLSLFSLFSLVLSSACAMGLLGRSRRRTDPHSDSSAAAEAQGGEKGQREWGLARVINLTAAQEVVNKSAEVRRVSRGWPCVHMCVRVCVHVCVRVCVCVCVCVVKEMSMKERERRRSVISLVSRACSIADACAFQVTTACTLLLVCGSVIKRNDAGEGSERMKRCLAPPPLALEPNKLRPSTLWPIASQPSAQQRRFI